MFQSSFELTGYITTSEEVKREVEAVFQSSFELTGYITIISIRNWDRWQGGFKALSSLQVI